MKYTTFPFASQPLCVSYHSSECKSFNLLSFVWPNCSRKKKRNAMQRLVSLLEKISDRSKNASNVTLANEEFLELATSLRETLQGEEGSTRKRLLDALQELGDRPAIRPEDLKKERRAQESGAMQQAEQQPTGTDTNPSHGATATVVRQATGTNEVLQPAAKRQRKVRILRFSSLSAAPSFQERDTAQYILK